MRRIHRKLFDAPKSYKTKWAESVDNMQFRIGRKPTKIEVKWIDGEPCVQAAITRACSGCTETLEGHNVLGHPVDPKWGCLVGSGCHECNYKGKKRDFFWIPAHLSSRKSCYTCKHLDYWDGTDGETLDPSGWYCDKRQATMNQYQESDFLRTIQSVDYRIRFKSCFEPKEKSLLAEVAQDALPKT